MSCRWALHCQQMFVGRSIDVRRIVEDARCASPSCSWDIRGSLDVPLAFVESSEMFSGCRYIRQMFDGCPPGVQFLFDELSKIFVGCPVDVLRILISMLVGCLRDVSCVAEDVRRMCSLLAHGLFDRYSLGVQSMFGPMPKVLVGCPIYVRRTTVDRCSLFD